MKAKVFQHRRDEIIDGWRLLRPLGSGGNAEVWVAQRNDGPEVALKMLKQTKPESEPYRRFVAEISALMQLGDRKGVLPLLDSSLPQRPSRGSIAWIAMPIGILIRDAIESRPELEYVVEAIAAIAGTLTVLASDYGMYHRDIKPENLYRYDQDWCVGDFGLVDVPSKEELTEPGRRIGPLYYHAPELLRDSNAAPGPLDVFSLAKTLWVLSVGQTYPMPGYLAASVEEYRISTYIPHARARPLELLIDRCTRPDPSKRPSMKDVAVELEAWRRHDHPHSLTLELGAATVRSIVRLQVEQEEARRRRHDAVSLSLDRLSDQMQAVGEAMEKGTGLSPQYGAFTTFSRIAEMQAFRQLPGYEYRHHQAVMVSAPKKTATGPTGVELHVGIGIAVDADGVAHMVAAHVIQERDHPPVVHWVAHASAPQESARESELLRELVAAAHARLPSALAELGEALEATEPILSPVYVTEPAVAPNVDLAVGDVLILGKNEIRWHRPSTGASKTVVAAGMLRFPRGIAVDHDRQIVVTDPGAFDGALIRVDPRTGRQTAFSRGTHLSRSDHPFGIAIEGTGDILVTNTNSGTIVRVQAKTGIQTLLVHSGGVLKSPRGLALDEFGAIYVADDQGQIVKVDSYSGAVVQIAAGELLKSPLGITVTKEAIIVSDGNVKRLIRFDRSSFAQALVSGGEAFVSPWGIAVMTSGEFLVADQGGAVMRVDPRTETTTPLLPDGPEAPVAVAVVETPVQVG